MLVSLQRNTECARWDGIIEGAGIQVSFSTRDDGESQGFLRQWWVRPLAEPQKRFSFLVPTEPHSHLVRRSLVLSLVLLMSWFRPTRCEWQYTVSSLCHLLAFDYPSKGQHPKPGFEDGEAACWFFTMTWKWNKLLLCLSHCIFGMIKA